MISSKVISEATGKPHPVVLKRIRKVIRSLERSNKVSKSNYEIVMNESRKLTVEIKMDNYLIYILSKDAIDLWAKNDMAAVCMWRVIHDNMYAQQINQPR